MTNSSNDTQSISVLPFVPPKAMRLPEAKVTATVAVGERRTSEHATAEPTAEITLSTAAVALYVVLTTTQPGRFSDNAILLEPGVARTVEFISWNSSSSTVDLAALKGSLRVEHLYDNL